MKKIIFGTDGIRGVANRSPISVEVAVKLGRAVVSVMVKGSIIIGGDSRKSSPMLMQAVAAGIASAGGDARLVGVIPTPGVSFLIRNEQAAGGVVVSASHNPAEDNGLKLFNSKGVLCAESVAEYFVLSEEKAKEVMNFPDPDAFYE